MKYFLVISYILLDIIYIVTSQSLNIPVQFVDVNNEKETNSSLNADNINLSLLIAYKKKQMLASIIIGTPLNKGGPKQAFNVLLDTGSDVLWVADKNCSGCKSNVNKYSATESSTSVNTFEYGKITYGTGQVSGYYYNDNVEFEGISTPIKGFKFLNCNYVMGNDIDGILGLAYISRGREYSIIQSMKDNGIIKENIISIDYSNYKTGKATFIIGEHPQEINYLLNRNTNTIDNKSYLGNCKLENTLHWGCKLQWIGLSDASDVKNKPSDFGGVAQSIIFDSGSTANLLNSDLYDYIVEKLFADFIKKNLCSITVNQGQSILICYKTIGIKTLKTLHFYLGNYAFYLKPEQYMRILKNPQGDESEFVSFEFIKLKGLEFNIFGDPSLLTLTTSYDGENGNFYYYSNQVYPTNKSNPTSDELIVNNKKNNLILIVIVVIVVAAFLCVLIYFGYRHYKQKQLTNNYNAFYNNSNAYQNRALL